MTETVAAAGPRAGGSRVPVHLWIVGVLSVLWGAMGAFDFTATQMRIEWYMSEFTEEQLAYFYGFPAWIVAAWALAVWGGLLGGIALLLRKRWAVWLFGVSLLGLVVSTVYTFAMSEGMEIMGTGASIFSGVIVVVTVALFLYTRRQAANGVLR